MPDPEDRVAFLADTRDSQAADRDDAADLRDGHALTRDRAAQQRDADAEQRVIDAQRSDYFESRFYETLRLILDHFTRIENTTIDPANWPDLDPDRLDHMRAFNAEQQRLSREEQVAISTLLHDFNDELGRRRDDQHAAGRDRDAAARDRSHAAADRRAAMGDRDHAARDRSQAAIEREQIRPRDAAQLVRAEHHEPEHDSLSDRVARAIETSRRRIADSRALQTSVRARRAGETAPEPQPERPDH